MTQSINKKREVFDKVKAHLLKQNRKSIKESGRGCLYRGPNGTMCAIGCLIPDELIKEDPFFDNEVAVDELSEKIKEAIGFYEILDEVFFENLQNIHDLHNPDKWPSLLDEFEEEYLVDS